MLKELFLRLLRIDLVLLNVCHINDVTKRVRKNAREKKEERREHDWWRKKKKSSSGAPGKRDEGDLKGSAGAPKKGKYQGTRKEMLKKPLSEGLNY